MATLVKVLKEVLLLAIKDEKFRKIVIGIVLGIIVIIIMPILFIVGMFSGDLDIDVDSAISMMEEYEEEVSAVWDELESAMEDESFTDTQKLRAEVLYTYWLVARKDTDNFVANFIECFEENQSDDALVDKVNSVFDSEISKEEFADVVEKVEYERAVAASTANASVARTLSVPSESSGTPAPVDESKVPTLAPPENNATMYP